MTADKPHESFWHDFAESFRVWRRNPRLPLLAIFIYAVPTLLPDSSVYFWLVLPIEIFNVGWVGVERIWYLRAFRGQSMHRGEPWKLAWAFFGRFARLGLLTLPLMLPVIFAASFVSRNEAILLVNLVWVPLELALTFVTPALAFTTNSVRTALSFGLRMIRTEWPAAAWYVLFPPLAVLTVARILPRHTLGTTGRFGLSVVVTLLYLAFKGATAAFYLRRHSVGDDGAAFVGQRDASPSPG